MINQTYQPRALDPKPDQRKPHEERLVLKTPRADGVWTDDVLLGMRMGNLILAAVYGVARIER